MGISRAPPWEGAQSTDTPPTNGELLSGALAIRAFLGRSVMRTGPRPSSHFSSERVLCEPVAWPKTRRHFQRHTSYDLEQFLDLREGNWVPVQGRTSCGPGTGLNPLRH